MKIAVVIIFLLILCGEIYDLFIFPYTMASGNFEVLEPGIVRIHLKGDDYKYFYLKDGKWKIGAVGNCFNGCWQICRIKKDRTEMPMYYIRPTFSISNMVFATPYWLVKLSK